MMIAAVCDHALVLAAWYLLYPPRTTEPKAPCSVLPVEMHSTPLVLSELWHRGSLRHHPLFPPEPHWIQLKCNHAGQEDNKNSLKGPLVSILCSSSIPYAVCKLEFGICSHCSSWRFLLLN